MKSLLAKMVHSVRADTPNIYNKQVQTKLLLSPTNLKNNIEHLLKRKLRAPEAEYWRGTGLEGRMGREGDQKQLLPP